MDEKPLTNKQVDAEVKRLYSLHRYSTEFFHPHFKWKSHRGILRQHVWEILEGGKSTGDPRPNGEGTGWLYPIEGRDSEDRRLRVIIEFPRDPRVPDRLMRARSAYDLDKED